MLSLRDAACLLVLVAGVGMSDVDMNRTAMKMTIGVTMKNSVGRFLILEQHDVVDTVFWSLLPMEMSAGDVILSPATRASVRA